MSQTVAEQSMNGNAGEDEVVMRLSIPLLFNHAGQSWVRRERLSAIDTMRVATGR